MPGCTCVVCESDLAHLIPCQEETNNGDEPVRAPRAA